MHAMLEKLTRIQPPPEDPIGTGNPEAWANVEAALGCQLPIDYKEYVMLYGAGTWVDFFGILTPFYRFRHPEGLEYFEWVRTRLDDLDEFRESFPECAPPFHRFPAQNGLIPIGYTDNGGTLCWHTAGQPDSWGVVCLDGKYGDGYDKFETSLTGFLAGFLGNHLIPATFPTDIFPLTQAAFVPYVDE